MISFAAAVTAMAILGGILVIGLGLVPRPYVARPASPYQVLLRRVIALTGGNQPSASRTRRRLVIGAVGGLLAWLLTGWLILVLLVPAAVAGLPGLLARSDSRRVVARLEALEEWTRSLAGVLTVGVGLEQALAATLKSTPDAIRPEVTTMVARLRARWPTVAALRAFADDLDDATGDLVASSLILGARRRGAGLAAVLEGLAATVADDVRFRRQIEVDRAKPRTTARIVTIITVAALGLLSLNQDYIEPYGTATGQVVLATLLGLYVLCLVWMRWIVRPRRLPRIMGSHLRAQSTLATSTGEPAALQEVAQ